MLVQEDDAIRTGLRQTPSTGLRHYRKAMLGVWTYVSLTSLTQNRSELFPRPREGNARYKSPAFYCSLSRKHVFPFIQLREKPYRKAYVKKKEKKKERNCKEREARVEVNMKCLALQT